MISIIIPVYNAEKTIKACLDSVLAQVSVDYEIIAVCDGAADKSAEILKTFQSSFDKAGKNFRLIVRRQNLGAQKTRNEGFSCSRGDYLLFLDSDIELKAGALREFLCALENNPKAGFAYSSHYFGNKLFRFWSFDGEKLKQMPYIHSTSLIRRACYPKSGWDENIKRLQDWDLFLTIFEAGYPGVWIDKVLFRVNPGGTMSSWIPSFFHKFFPFLKSVKKYNGAVRKIKEKHNLK